MAEDTFKKFCYAGIGAVELLREKLSELPDTIKESLDELAERGERLADTEDSLAGALLAALEIRPRMPTSEEVDDIIPGYDDMKATEIIDQIQSVSTKQLEIIRDYEQHNYNRVRVLRQINKELNEMRIIPEYDKLSVGAVVEKLHELSPQELAALRDYEKSHRNRTTVLSAIDRWLASPA
jgi:hypothetical protein